MDQSNLNQADVDRVFVAVNVNLKRNKLNPERSVCRFEMIEALIRFAHEKYVQGSAKTSSITFTSICLVPVSGVPTRFTFFLAL